MALSVRARSGFLPGSGIKRTSLTAKGPPPGPGISALGLNEQPIKILRLAAPREEKGRRATVRELIFMIPKSFWCLLFVAKAATFFGLTVCPALHMAHLFPLIRDPMGRVLS